MIKTDASLTPQTTCSRENTAEHQGANASGVSPVASGWSMPAIEPFNPYQARLDHPLVLVPGSAPGAPAQSLALVAPQGTLSQTATSSVARTAPPLLQGDGSTKQAQSSRVPALALGSAAAGVGPFGPRFDIKVRAGGSPAPAAPRLMAPALKLPDTPKVAPAAPRRSRIQTVGRIAAALAVPAAGVSTAGAIMAVIGHGPIAIVLAAGLTALALAGTLAVVMDWLQHMPTTRMRRALSLLGAPAMAVAAATTSTGLIMLLTTGSPLALPLALIGGGALLVTGAIAAVLRRISPAVPEAPAAKV